MVTKVLARDWKTEVLIKGTLDSISSSEYEVSSDAEWMVVNGLNSLKFSSENTTADTTSFDEAGRTSHLVASRGNSLGLEGKYLEDQGTGARDKGQEFIEDLADKIGPSAMGVFRLTSPGGTERVFRASVKLSDLGGGTDDPTSWGAELTTSGILCKKKPQVSP